MEDQKPKKSNKKPVKDSQALTLKGEPAAPRIPGNVTVRMPAGQGLAQMEVNNEIDAHNNPEFMDALSTMILATRKDGQWHSDFEFAMMQEAMKRMDPPPRPVEVYNAFWEAYGDKFTPATGVEWKNMATKIKENRENSYTPPPGITITKQKYLENKVQKLKRKGE